MNKLNNYPYNTHDSIWGLIQLIVFITALFKRDWFLLATVFVMNINKINVVLWKDKKTKKIR